MLMYWWCSLWNDLKSSWGRLWSFKCPFEQDHECGSIERVLKICWGIILLQVWDEWLYVSLISHEISNEMFSTAHDTMNTWDWVCFICPSRKKNVLAWRRILARHRLVGMMDTSVEKKNPFILVRMFLFTKNTNFWRAQVHDRLLTW